MHYDAIYQPFPSQLSIFEDVGSWQPCYGDKFTALSYPPFEQLGLEEEANGKFSQIWTELQTVESLALYIKKISQIQQSSIAKLIFQCNFLLMCFAV